jgi:hypothetical protein
MSGGTTLQLAYRPAVIKKTVWTAPMVEAQWMWTFQDGEKTSTLLMGRDGSRDGEFMVHDYSLDVPRSELSKSMSHGFELSLIWICVLVLFQIVIEN